MMTLNVDGRVRTKIFKKRRMRERVGELGGEHRERKAQ